MYNLETEYNLSREIKMAFDIINDGLYIKDADMNKINSFSAEESTIYTGENMRYKSFVTDGSSIDQIFNVELNDCKDITLIDSCPFKKYYYYLKVAALLELNHIQFLKFLCNEKNSINESFLDRQYFEKIKPILLKLNYESYIFWSALYDRVNPREISSLFNKGEGSLKIQFANKYLNNPGNYQLIREKVQHIKPKFINDNILNIEKYRNPQNIDFINICNILSYINGSDFKKQEFIQFINSLKRKISDEGKMVLHYGYQNYNGYQINKNLIGLAKIISASDNATLKDGCIVYKKTK